jgi:hypothetical protein
MANANSLDTVGGLKMIPYSAQDLVNVMRHELTPEVERRHGAHVAQDIQRDDAERDDTNRPDKGERFSLRLFFFRGAALARGAS